MLAKYPLAPPALPSDAGNPHNKSAPGAVPLPGSDVAELIHLARAVLSKSPADLAAIAEAAPAFPANWVDAFKEQQSRARAEAAFWAAAIAYLTAIDPCSTANENDAFSF